MLRKMAGKEGILRIKATAVCVDSRNFVGPVETPHLAKVCQGPFVQRSLSYYEPMLRVHSAL